MTRHPIGINQRQNTDDARVLAYLQSCGGVQAHLCHFDTGALPRMHQFKPHVETLIWRPRDDTQERLHLDHPDAEAYIKHRWSDIATAGFSRDEVWLHLHNEADWSVSMLDWEYQAAKAAVALDMKVVVLNPSVGTPNENAVYMAEKIIRLAADHPDQIMIGVHEYFSVYGHRHRPWYLGRWGFDFETGYSFESFRKAKGIGPVRYIITEFGADNVADDAKYTEQFRDWFETSQGRERLIPKGVHQLDKAWSRTYNDPQHNIHPAPYLGLDAAYFEQVTTAFKVGDYSNPAIAGVLLFCWGQEWKDFDVSAMTVFKQKLAAWRPEPLEVPAEPTPPAPPAIAEPPPADDDTPAHAPDGLTRAQAALNVVNAKIAALDSEQAFVTQQYQAQLAWLDTRRNELQAELILAELDVKAATKAA